jgi:hypothetical protein
MNSRVRSVEAKGHGSDAPIAGSDRPEQSTSGKKLGDARLLFEGMGGT